MLVAVAERVHLDAVVFGSALVVGFNMVGLEGESARWTNIQGQCVL